MTSEESKFPTYEDECDGFLTDLAEIEAALTRKDQDATLRSDLTHEAKLVVGGACVHCLASRVNASDLAEYFESAEEAAESELFDAAMCLYAFEGLIAASSEQGDTLDQVVVDGLKSCQEWVSIAKDRLRLIKAAHDSLTAAEKHNF